MVSTNRNSLSNLQPALVQWKNIDEPSLDALLASREGICSLMKLQGSNAIAVVDFMDRTLNNQVLDSTKRRKYFQVLRRLCGTRGVLPTSCILTGKIKKTAERPEASGGFADVWKGTYNGHAVSIKALRMYSSEELDKVKKRFFQEILLWKSLSHPNILPFYGVATVPFQFCLVTPWMKQGNIANYLKDHPDANRLSLLLNIVDGLHYLHSNGIVHADLKGSNVLITDDNTACLTDSALIIILSDTNVGHMTATGENYGTSRWMAPELLIPEAYGFKDCIPSKQSDIYAFGMVIYEVMTSSIPFKQYGNFAVVPKVVNGTRPDRPTSGKDFGMTDSIWGIAEKCWHQQLEERPSVSEVHDLLKEAALSWVPQSAVRTRSAGSSAKSSEKDSESRRSSQHEILNEVQVVGPAVRSS